MWSRFLIACVLLGAAMLSHSAASAGDAAAARKGKWIEVSLANQRLTAWENGRMMMSVPVSTGARATPTPRGRFRIFAKYRYARMRGPGYDLPRVPYVMYFRRGGYAIHGTYWHNDFGTPRSRGCVNMRTGDAAWLYRWAPIGTLVVVH